MTTENPTSFEQASAAGWPHLPDRSASPGGDPVWVKLRRTGTGTARSIKLQQRKFRRQPGTAARCRRKFTGPSRTVAVDGCPRERDRIAGFAPLQPFPTAKSGGRSFWLPNHPCRAESSRRLSCSRVTLVQSHATVDNATAVALHVWLREHGFEDLSGRDAGVWRRFPASVGRRR
jgi:hypothetical protein